MYFFCVGFFGINNNEFYDEMMMSNNILVFKLIDFVNFWEVICDLECKVLIFEKEKFKCKESIYI